MRRIGIGSVVTAAIVVAALSAASVAAASVNPEYLVCGKVAKVNKKYTGHYTNKECSQVSATNEGKYERQAPIKPVKTKAKFGLTTVYLYKPGEPAYESEVPCEKGSASGEITGGREQTLTITYSGCVIPKEFKDGAKAKFFGPCESPGESEKKATIVTKPLATKLVWLNSEETEPGILVSAAEPGGLLEEAECFLKKIDIKQTGSMLARIAPENEFTELLTATFTASSVTGEPELTTYWEGGTPTEVKLFSAISGLATYPAVPTAETSTVPQKSKAILIG
jgi:hypothetical protein